MAFRKAGMKVAKRRRVKKSKAHQKFGRVKVIQAPIDSHERKVGISFSLPAWMIGWIEEESRRAGMHKSTFVAACVESTRQGMIAADEAQARVDEMAEEVEDLED